MINVFALKSKKLYVVVRIRSKLNIDLKENPFRNVTKNIYSP